MAEMRQVVRQWLETDAALGATEVPLSGVAEAPAAIAPAAIAPAGMASGDHGAALLAATMPRPAAVRENSQGPATTAGRGAASREEPVARKKASSELPAAPAGNIADLPPMAREEKERALAALRARVEADSQCFINEMSTRLVFGEGDPDAEILFVGEGPGVEEDKTGRPFVGRSGQLLDKMIAAMGFKREELPEGRGGAYIANVVKLRCADMDEGSGRLKDRPPTPEEAARGLPILHEQIAIIRPQVIVTLGAPAVKYLTGTTEGVMKLRGTWLGYRGIPVMPTYHPSFLLRAYTQENRAKVWSDLQAAVKRLKRSR